MDAAAPLPLFAERFAAALTLLRRTVQRHNGAGVLTPILAVAVARSLNRKLARFLALVALWRAGRLTPPRRRVAQASVGETEDADAPVQAPAPRLRFPRTADWLRACLPWAAQDISSAAGLLSDALENHAEMRDFLAACPRARRLIRPVWRAIISGPPPAAIRLPPRPRRPRPPRPRARPARMAHRYGIETGLRWGGAIPPHQPPTAPPRNSAKR